jgi:hypothetical protein
MITAKEAKKITEDSHPYATEIPSVKKVYVETVITRAAKTGKLYVSFNNSSMSEEWLQISYWLSSYGYSCWFDANNNLHARWGT